MNRKVNALKKFCAALSSSTAAQFQSGNVVGVLKEFAVKLNCAASVEEIRATGIAGVLNYIAANYGSESNEPYDMSITQTHATVTVKRGNKSIAAGSDVLYNGDKITITATAAEGYKITALTVNGAAFTSGNKFTVNGAAVAIVATAALQTFDLDRTADENCSVAVTKGGNAVTDGEDVLNYGDVITITATAAENYTVDELTVNGAAFTSGNTLTVKGDVEITATSAAVEQQETPQSP